MKDIKLYNVMFPIWLLWLFPMTWLVILPGNFIIDFLVVLLTLKYLKVDDIKVKINQVIFRVWVMGFVADFIGCIGMFIFNLVEIHAEWPSSEMMYALNYNPFMHPGAFLWTTLCTVVTAIIIYAFNYRWCLNKADLTDSERRKVALAMAVFTAPYLFYLPTSWFI